MTRPQIALFIVFYNYFCQAVILSIKFFVTHFHTSTYLGLELTFSGPSFKPHASKIIIDKHDQVGLGAKLRTANNWPKGYSASEVGFSLQCSSSQVPY